MSQISIVLGLVPYVPPFNRGAKLFDVDEYRDNLSQKIKRIELTNLEYLRLKAAEKAKLGLSRNRTLASDKLFLGALKNGPRTVLQISVAVNRTEHYTRQKMKFLADKRLVKKAGTVGGKSNSAVLWKLI